MEFGKISTYKKVVGYIKDNTFELCGLVAACLKTRLNTFHMWLETTSYITHLQEAFLGVQVRCLIFCSQPPYRLKMIFKNCLSSLMDMYQFLRNIWFRLILYSCFNKQELTGFVLVVKGEERSILDSSYLAEHGVLQESWSNLTETMFHMSLKSTLYF